MSERCSSPPDGPLGDVGVWYAYVDLTHRYAEAIDEHGGVGIGDLFVADGTWDGAAFRLALVEGRDAIAAFFEGADGPAWSVHLVQNHRLVSRSEGRAIATSLTYAIQASEDGPKHLVVRYEDELVDDGDGGWRFASRRLLRGPRI